MFDWIKNIFEEALIKNIFEIFFISYEGTFRQYFHTRDKMKLTRQLKAELNAISERAQELTVNFTLPILTGHGKEPGGSISPFPKEIIRTKAKELKTLKIRLENILCETDVKEQVKPEYSQFLLKKRERRRNKISH